MTELPTTLSDAKAVSCSSCVASEERIGKSCGEAFVQFMSKCGAGEGYAGDEGIAPAFRPIASASRRDTPPEAIRFTNVSNQCSMERLLLRNWNRI